MMSDDQTPETPAAGPLEPPGQSKTPRVDALAEKIREERGADAMGRAIAEAEDRRAVRDGDAHNHSSDGKLHDDCAACRSMGESAGADVPRPTPEEREAFREAAAQPGDEVEAGQVIGHTGDGGGRMPQPPGMARPYEFGSFTDVAVEPPGVEDQIRQEAARLNVADARDEILYSDGGGPLPLATPEGLQEVIAVARRATAHNYGETVWEYAILDPSTYMLRMSSWPRANEARDGLQAAGYAAEHMPPDGGHPRIEVKAKPVLSGDPAALGETTEARIPVAPDWAFSDEAVAGLVGQSVKVLTEPGRWESVVGNATVTAARNESDGVYVTLDVKPINSESGARLAEMLAIGRTRAEDVSIGFQPQSVRQVQMFDAVKAFEIGPAPAKPFPRVQVPRTHGQEYDGDPEQGGKPL